MAGVDFINLSPFDSAPQPSYVPTILDGGDDFASMLEQARREQAQSQSAVQDLADQQPETSSNAHLQQANGQPRTDHNDNTQSPPDLPHNGSGPTPPSTPIHASVGSAIARGACIAGHTIIGGLEGMATGGAGGLVIGGAAGTLVLPGVGTAGGAVAGVVEGAGDGAFLGTAAGAAYGVTHCGNEGPPQHVAATTSDSGASASSISASSSAKSDGPSEVQAAQGDKASPAIKIDEGSRQHILDGDATGGGHRPGTGHSGKSEFPAGWSDDKIVNTIEDVADDPTSKRTVQKNGRTRVEGTRDGVDVTVIVNPDGRSVRTAFPTNMPRNP